MPVILLSGFTEAEVRRRHPDLGLAAFLQKPFSLGALVALVARTMEAAYPSG